MNRFLQQLKQDENGATILEYGLLAAIIAIALIGIWQQIGFDLRPIFNTIAGKVDETTDEAKDDAG